MEPASGAISWQVHEIPPEVAPADGRRHGRRDAAATTASTSPGPGRHRTETLDLLLMLDGETVMGLDDGEVAVRGGDAVVQRGTWHSWHNRTGRSYGASVVMFRVPAGTPPPGSHLTGLVRRRRRRPGPAPVGHRHHGRRAAAFLAADGAVPHAVFVEHGPGIAQIELWQTLGPVVDAGQGGDDAHGDFSLDPIGGGASWRLVTLPAAGVLDGRTLDDTARAAMGEEIRRRLPGLLTSGEHDPDRPGRHRTDTLDLLQVVSGPACGSCSTPPRSSWGRATASVQRGTWHTWENRGPDPSPGASCRSGWGRPDVATPASPTRAARRACA